MKPLHAWLSTPIRRNTRRVLVVAAAAAVVLWVVLALSGVPMSDTLVVPLVLLWTLVVLRLGFATRRLTDRSADCLDERELELRNHVYFRSYQVAMAVGLPLLLAVLAVWAFDLPLGRPDDPSRPLLLVLVGYVSLVLNLPWALLAWTFPDPVDPDPLDELGRVSG